MTVVIREEILGCYNGERDCYNGERRQDVCKLILGTGSSAKIGISNS